MKSTEKVISLVVRIIDKSSTQNHMFNLLSKQRLDILSTTGEFMDTNLHKTNTITNNVTLTVSI